MESFRVEGRGKEGLPCSRDPCHTPAQSKLNRGPQTEVLDEGQRASVGFGAEPGPTAAVKHSVDAEALGRTSLARSFSRSLCPPHTPSPILLIWSYGESLFSHLCNMRHKVIKIHPTPVSAWPCFVCGSIHSVFWEPWLFGDTDNCINFRRHLLSPAINYTGSRQSCDASASWMKKAEPPRALARRAGAALTARRRSRP